MNQSRSGLSRGENLITGITLSLFFCAFIVHIGLHQWWGWTLNIVPDEARGEIYPLNLHGHIVYLNRIQHLWIEYTKLLSLVFGLSLGVVGFVIQRRHKQKFFRNKL